ncbi:tRNA wybutosine-synthesizing protein 2 homolog isoform X2 [Pecten maximus]|uniref:tRNA wybutosine-synthesizing protein 2 homolog isoform X2 n=1 Tax=Pecten maximus TaxID=6579 RepID=UPI0014585FC6|nr:tRNA wybutosine-synthesizing protein 2 homolog isoform X2 [Pecten maximus]
MQGMHRKQILEDNKIFDNRRRLKKISEGRIAIPLKESGNLEPVVEALCKIGITIEKESWKLPLSKSALARTPYDSLVASICDLLGKDDVDFSTLLKDIPTHWERHGDLIVFPVNFFTQHAWQGLGARLWEAVATSLGCSRLAQKGTISSNGYRSPQVVLLLGESGWVEHVDNSIRYTYDITKCMFSAGNITEKLRVAGFNCAGETVVDLYAGIGYFTLPYLVHAKAEHVHACEWNPDAVEALKKTLVLNHVFDRCTIHQGDNKQTCPRNIADRVNLGLIPSSEEGWPVACRALRSSGGFLHIHSNVTSKHPSNTDIGNHGDTIDKSDSSICLKYGNANHVSLKGSTDIDDLTQDKSVAFNVNKDSSKKELNMAESEGKANNRKKKFCNSDICDDASQCTVKCERDKNNLSCDNTSKNQDNVGETTVIASGTSNQGFPSLKKICSCKNKKINQRSATEISKGDWHLWAEDVAQKISQLCTQVRNDNCLWTANIIHIEHVKSYAPHVDHLVLDLECRPATDK